MEWEKSAQIRRSLTTKATVSGIPISGTFELTPRCNLCCKMCYIRLTPEQMAPIGREYSTAEWIELAHQAKKAGMLFLLLTGGEPTLRSDFLKIYEELAKMGFSISINTNGTLFGTKLRKVFHRFPPAQINITLYGVSREEYAAVCGDPDVYNRVIDAIHWLKSEKILVHLNSTMTPENIKCWEAYEKFAEQEKLELRMTTYCFPPARRGDFREFIRLEPEVAGELSVKDMLYRDGVEAVRERARHLEKPLSSCKLDIGDPIQCMAAKSQFWITWDGRMTPCGMLNQPATHPFEKGFEKAWEDLREQTAKIRLCPECHSCPERASCLNCAAVTFTETGHFDGKPEYACRMNRGYREALKRYSE